MADWEHFSTMASNLLITPISDMQSKGYGGNHNVSNTKPDIALSTQANKGTLVLPLFLRHKDLLQPSTTGLDIGEALIEKLGDSTLVLVVQPRQIYGGETLWRIHLKTDKPGIES